MEIWEVPIYFDNLFEFALDVSDSVFPGNTQLLNITGQLFKVS